MATLKASFGTVNGRSETGSTVPVLHLNSAVRLADLTTSGTSAIVQAVGGGDWVAPSDGVVTFQADGPVTLTAGAAPIASTTTGCFVPGTTFYAFTVSEGEKVAAIDA